jgi:hypothetical protein
MSEEWKSHYSPRPPTQMLPSRAHLHLRYNPRMPNLDIELGEWMRNSVCRHGSSWLFPNSLGGPIDLSNLADRVIQPSLEKSGLE